MSDSNKLLVLTDETHSKIEVYSRNNEHNGKNSPKQKSAKSALSGAHRAA